MLKEKYDGDARNLRVEVKDAVRHLKEKLKEFKGIGNNGAEIFIRGAQVWWDELFPFLDKERGKARAEELSRVT